LLEFQSPSAPRRHAGARAARATSSWIITKHVRRRIGAWAAIPIDRVVTSRPRWVSDRADDRRQPLENRHRPFDRGA